MECKKKAFVIDSADNVATALEALEPGKTSLTGAASGRELSVTEPVPAGHKVALRSIGAGEDIVKYGVVIGRAVKQIPAGAWVHLHCMRSLVDERSSHLDVVTGAPCDTEYE